MQSGAADVASNKPPKHAEIEATDEATSSSTGPLAELVKRYRGPLLTYFSRHAHPEDAEDLVQETFVRLLRKGDVDSIVNTEAFLFTIARNLTYDRTRRRQTYARHFDATAEADDATELYGPERVLESREALQGLLEGLAGLSEQTRDILLLHRLEGMKYAEIAELYGISRSAVEKHMIKALARVAAYVAKDGKH